MEHFGEHLLARPRRAREKQGLSAPLRRFHHLGVRRSNRAGRQNHSLAAGLLFRLVNAVLARRPTPQLLEQPRPPAVGRSERRDMERIARRERHTGRARVGLVVRDDDRASLDAVRVQPFLRGGRNRSRIVACRTPRRRGGLIARRRTPRRLSELQHDLRGFDPNGLSLRQEHPSPVPAPQIADADCLGVAPDERVIARYTGPSDRHGFERICPRRPDSAVPSADRAFAQRERRAGR